MNSSEHIHSNLKSELPHITDMDYIKHRGPQFQLHILFKDAIERKYIYDHTVYTYAKLNCKRSVDGNHIQ